MVDSAATVVLDYCAAVRGILNDDQGGPLDPPGLRMAETPCMRFSESIQRNLDEKKGGSRKSNSAACSDASRAGLDEVEEQQEVIRDIRRGDRGGGRDPRTRDRGYARSGRRSSRS